MTAGKWPSLRDLCERLGLNPDEQVADYRDDAPLDFTTLFGAPDDFVFLAQAAKRKKRGKKAPRQ